MADGSTQQSKVSWEIYRTDTEVELGAVKSKYEVFQNRDAFAFGDALVKSGQAHWTDAGMQNDGYRVFMVMKLSEDFTVLGEDKTALYLFLRTSHDGSTSVSGYVTPIRFFCTNQLQMISNTTKTKFTVQHTSNIGDRIAKAQASLKLATEYVDIYREQVERLVKTSIGESSLEFLLKQVIPENRSSRDKMIEGITSNYLNSVTVDPYRGTAYGVLNAVTEYMDHIKTQRTGNARFESIMFSEGKKVRENLTKQLLALS
jgi:phage/plasmid-like protein (TIGR03299 family)